MKFIRLTDMLDVPVTLRQQGSPGEPTVGEVGRVQRFIDVSAGAEAMIMGDGAESFWWVDATRIEPICFEDDGPVNAIGDGFAVGAGDGATLPGLPLGWRLLYFSCPRGDSPTWVARYPVVPLVCPQHHLTLQRGEAAP